MLIGDLSKTAGVTKEAIRHYMDIGLLKPTPKQAGSRLYNDFSDTDIQRLKWIVLGKSLGFTLSEIEHYLNLFMDNKLPQDKMMAMFKEKLEEIDMKIEQLESIKKILISKLKK